MIPRAGEHSDSSLKIYICLFEEHSIALQRNPQENDLRSNQHRANELTQLLISI